MSWLRPEGDADASGAAGAAGAAGAVPLIRHPGTPESEHDSSSQLPPEGDASVDGSGQGHAGHEPAPRLVAGITSVSSDGRATKPTVRPLRLGRVVLGSGRPAICVPLVQQTVDELRAAVLQLPADDFDLVEIRIDHFADVDDHQAVLSALEAVRHSLAPGIPILFTFRSRPEGGARDIDLADYEALLALAAKSGLVDAIDVEMFTELGGLERIVNGAHAQGCAVIMSSHDFEKTPQHHQIIARLSLQQDLGADVVKLAAMPTNAADVLTLLSATEEFVRTLATRPVITMAMGPLGVVTRLAGETFGSCLTFGSVGEASAPGQVGATELRRALELVHGAQAR
jgi:3-dehydroquinate dehydratase I